MGYIGPVTLGKGLQVCPSADRLHETDRERREREAEQEAREQTWQRRWRREALGLNRGK